MKEKAEAKKNMLSYLSDEMRSMMGEGRKGSLKDKMMKVTVAGDNPKSVEKGLDKAKEIMKMKMGMDHDMSKIEDEMEPDDESPEEIEDVEAGEDYDESAEEIQEKIEELKRKLASIKE